jgi:hypothetical protein
MRKAVGAVVDASGRHPLVVLFLALCALGGTWYFALQVLTHPHTDLRELLPSDSPGLKAFEHQLGRVGGGATLIVIAESPSRADNERFVDDLNVRLKKMASQEGDHGGAPLIAYLEGGSKDVHRFFEDNKWLYADTKDLEDAYETIDHQIAIRSGLVEDLGDEPAGDPHPGTPQVKATGEKKPALGLDDYRAKWKSKSSEAEDFPRGYFETDDGTMIGLRVVSSTTGMGDAGGDTLLARIQRLVEEMKPSTYQAEMKVGFAGDIPNAAAEKESIISEAVWATGIAFIVIIAGVVWFYRSAWSLVVIALPALLGVGAAYAFAYFRFGYVNTTGMFLGAIILGNGINYPIVLLSRYREFRARGQDPAEARREAVQNALRAELVGACVASIAYGSLEWIQSKLPRWMRDPEPRIRADGSRGPVTRLLALVTERWPWALLGGAAAVTAMAAWQVPGFLRDPWEYNFDHLGSRGGKQGGAGEWSNKAERVFGGKMNVAGALMLADSAEQVPVLKAQILANDAADPQGKLIADVATVYDLLPGTPAEQKKKLEVLDRIRDRLTPRVLADLPADERARVDELRPPERLRVLEPKDLPPLLRRRFEENDGRVGTVFYVKYGNDVSLSDGHNLLRLARDTDNVRLPDGTVVQTASRSTIFAEMIRSMERDGPRATVTSLLAVALVVLLSTRNVRGALAVLAALLMGVIWLVGGAAWFGEKLNYVNFITLPITFGIGCEYPFNVYDRSRLLGGDVSSAVRRVGGAVALCSFTTVVGYSSLLFADFQALQSFGRLAVSGELACLAGALVMLPALLHVLGKRRSFAGTAASTRAGD